MPVDTWTNDLIKPDQEINPYQSLPVELINFDAAIIGSTVVIKWSTATETNNSGFSIERKSVNSEYAEIGFIPGFGTTTEPKSYSYTDSKILTGKYNYRLKQIDFDGSFEYSDVVEVEVTTPLEYALEQNYPNPFNPTTTIKFELPEKNFVQLKIFDVLGSEVATLMNEEKAPGSYEVFFDAAKLVSGVYIYSLKAGNFTQSKKMILMK